ncbi:MAG: efflux RND transporter periplasmic adaptor subunit [Pseudomonadota bacterium]
MKDRAIKISRSLLVLVLAVVVAAVLVRLRPKPQRTSPPPPSFLVEVLEVKVSSPSMIIKSYGTVRPRETLNLVSEVRGKVVEMAPTFEEGGFFKKDSVLIRIDPRSYELAVAQRKKQLKQLDAELRRIGQERTNLEATLEIAVTDAELARDDWKRFEALAKREVIARAALDQAKQKYLASRSRMQEIENQIALIDPRVDQLRAQRELVEVQLQDAFLDLDRTRIEAPFDGWVLEKRVERQQFVGQGTHLGSIYNASTLEVEVRIPFKDLHWLGELPTVHDIAKSKPGSFLSSTPVATRIIFDSPGQTHVWDGRLTRIKAQVDDKTRTLPLVIEVPAIKSRTEGRLPYPLKPGMFVNVELIGRKIDKAFLLPRFAVHPGNLVYLANNNRLVIREVTVLRQLDDSVYVTEGLKDGDQVVITPISTPKEDTELRVRRVE